MGADTALPLIFCHGWAPNMFAPDCPITTVSKYENGEVLLHAELLAQLATILDVSADELLGLRRKRARKPAAAAPAPVIDKGLARRFALLQGLSRRDKETVARTIDALVAARGGPGRAA